MKKQYIAPEADYCLVRIEENYLTSAQSLMRDTSNMGYTEDEFWD